MVYFAKHHSAVGFTSVELRQFLKCATAVLVVCAQYRKSHQHLIGVQSRVMSLQIRCLGVLYRLDHILWYQLHRMVYAGKMLDGVEYHGGTRTEKRA